MKVFYENSAVIKFYGIIAKISQICALIRYHEAYAEFVDIALVVD